MVRTLQEDWWIVVDVLNFYNELRRWFQGPVGGPIHSLSQQRILGFFFPVQRFGDMNISCLLVNHKDCACAFSGQHILDTALPVVHISVKLAEKQSREREREKLAKMIPIPMC